MKWEKSYLEDDKRNTGRERKLRIMRSLVRGDGFRGSWRRVRNWRRRRRTRTITRSSEN